MEKILSQGQACAVKDAMISLNNINGKVGVEFKAIHVAESFDGRVFITNTTNNAGEHYSNQDEFFAAYKV